MRLLLLASVLLPLAACKITSRASCDVVEREVADDDALGDLDYTVADILTATAGDFTVDLVDESSAPHSTLIRTVRGEGPAVFFDSTPTSVETRSFGLGHETLLIAVKCEDDVHVPIALSMESEDEAIVVDGEAEAWVEPDDAALVVTVTRELDLNAETLPPPTGNRARAFVEVQYVEGELAYASGWWEGEGGRETSVTGP